MGVGSLAAGVNPETVQFAIVDSLDHLPLLGG